MSGTVNVSGMTPELSAMCGQCEACRPGPRPGVWMVCDWHHGYWVGRQALE